ncbi:acyltransferase, partial [Paracidovorax avenae]
LWELNRHPSLDAWAVYFFGAYGLGMMARWAVAAPRGSRAAAAWLVLIGVWGAVALALDFRGRIAVAWCAALGLVLLLRWQQGRAALQRAGMPAAHRAQSAWSGGLARLGRISYSVFLVHFPVCLLVNAAVTKAWPESVALNALGMVAALALSIAAGWLLYERVERQVPSWTMALRWQAGLVGAGLVVALAAGHLG